MKPLTPRQQQVYDLIKSKIEDTGMPPTRAEIARDLVFVQPMQQRSTLKPSLASKRLKLFQERLAVFVSC